MFGALNSEGKTEMPEDKKTGEGETPTLEALQAELAGAREDLEKSKGKIKKLSDEAAAARVARKDEYEATIAGLKEQIESIKAGGPTSKADDAEIAKLRGEISDLRKKDETREAESREAKERARTRAHKAKVAELVAKKKLLEPDDAMELLLRRTKLADDEETLLFSSKDKETNQDVELALTEQLFSPETGLLGKSFWPAQGSGGSGGKPTGSATGGETIDEQRALNDPAYFQKHEKELIARRRARETGNA